MISHKELRQWGEDDNTARRDAWETLLLEIDASISLTASQYAGLESRYESISAILEDPNDPELGDMVVFPQGSVRTHTVTRPPDDSDVDIDAIAYIKGGTHLAPVDLLDRLFVELDARARTGGDVVPSNRCVTVQYNDEQLPCHLDVTPAERKPGNPNDDGSGRLRVPDRKCADWSPSNPKDFADWFEDIAGLQMSVLIPEAYRQLLIAKRGETEPLPSHDEITAPNGLRVGVRLMKRHRDMYIERTGRTKSKPISVLVTTLAAKAYERVARRNLGRTLTPLQILEQIAAEMANCFDAPWQGEQYRLQNPKDPEENFAEKWNKDPALPRTFFAWQNDLVRTLRYGLIEFPSKARFRTELTESFGTSAGKACDEYFAEIRDGVYPGLSAGAARSARVAGQSAALIGLGSAEPTRAAEPKPLDRLG